MKANVDKHMVDEHNITGFQYYKDYIAEVGAIYAESDAEVIRFTFWQAHQLRRFHIDLSFYFLK